MEEKGKISAESSERLELVSGIVEEPKIRPKEVAKKVVKAAVVAVAPVLAVPKIANAVKTTAPKAVSFVHDQVKKGQLKKYNPLFTDEYISPEFKLPNMIRIVDDAVRKDIEVCKGSIGWIEKTPGMEVLCLYDEEVENSGIRFVPAAICDAFYYVDPHDRQRFINVDDFFDEIQQQKIAELAGVASSLGAKSYSIKIFEDEQQSKNLDYSMKDRVKLLGNGGGDEENYESHIKNASKRIYSTAGEFEEQREPEKPELHWYIEDHNIVGLIRDVCSGKKVVRKEFDFAERKYAAMDAAVAAQIDATVKGINANTKVSMSSKCEKEMNRHLELTIEFR